VNGRIPKEKKGLTLKVLGEKDGFERLRVSDPFGRASQRLA
jgi:hypothetical protein